jgi:hypothetical protein
MSANLDTHTQIPEIVRSAVVRVCRDAFHWRDDLRALFIGCGVPDSLYERYDQPERSKPKIARAVLHDLVRMGPQGTIIQHKLIEELCRMDRPHPDAPDQAKGKAALMDLKREATAHQILVSPDQAATTQRRARAEQQRHAQTVRRERLGHLQSRFYDLLRLQPRTVSERQQRGYALEVLLADLFDAYDIEYRRPYRTTHEQVDGSFHFRGFTYIVEAKWQTQSPSFDQLAKFKFNVDGKLDSTRGMLFAMAGFDEGTLEHLFKVARGSRNNLILVDHLDLITIFEGRMALTDALIVKIDAAEQEGRSWLPLGR